MITPTLLNTVPAAASAPASPGAAAAADGAAETGFAALFGAGIAHAPASLSADDAIPGKPAHGKDDKAGADTDPATLLDAIAAGQAGLGAQNPTAAALATHTLATHVAQAVDAHEAAKARAGDDAATSKPRDGKVATGPSVGPAPGTTPEPAASTTVPPVGKETRAKADAEVAAPAAPPAAPSPAVLPAVASKVERPEPAPQPAASVSSLLAPAHVPSAAHAQAGAVNVAQLERLAQPLGTRDWEDGLATRVVWMAKNDVQTASIRLNPPDLGPVEVKLTLTGDAGAASASVQFSAAHSATRDAIESALPRLQEMLKENGIALGNASVDARTAGNASAFADSGRDARGGQSQPGAGSDPQQDAAAQPRTQATVRRGNGLVDTFA